MIDTESEGQKRGETDIKRKRKKKESEGGRESNIELSERGGERRLIENKTEIRVEKRDRDG